MKIQQENTELAQQKKKKKFNFQLLNQFHNLIISRITITVH